MASRRKGRILALMGLYQIDLVKTPIDEALTFKYYDKPTTDDERDYAKALIKGVVDNWELIDNTIKDNSKNWDIKRISIVNRCILRLSIYSLMNEQFVPHQVVIDEALELTREFESEESVGFINGLLDAVHKKLVL
ncbi:transcription antitermination factor NusB [Leptospira sp. GIMC2001]|uniref:transcription antitermination factor NusB n=1 Tax=Leptospira sp. GIMC2001 TaxID=1513297 RepID=UPI00234B4042|nr:transcription antitermination factor NusB [Leptospira sp. GIMC2001]WCL48215.1 transcription antitermination factor NusB [Leptospira sp. GIMC2001]